MNAIATSRFLKPDVLARLGTLELVARTVVDGVLVGLHRSPDFGFSQEFAEYRAYNDGDDLRHVDWNVYARADRMVVKRYKGETNSAVTLVLDVSASMNFGSPVKKIDQARFLTASLAYLARKQRDALGLVLFDEKIHEFIAPNARPDSLTKILSALESVNASETGNGTDMFAALSNLRLNMDKRGLLILVSDFYDDIDTIVSAIQPLVHAGQDTVLFHLVDNEELSPQQNKIVALRDIETNEEVIVSPEYLNGEYKHSFDEHRKQLSKKCSQMGADYIELNTADSLDNAIGSYLQLRERRG